MPSLLALYFDIDLEGKDANNFLLQSVMWQLVQKLVMKFGDITVQGTVDHHIYTTFKELFFLNKQHDNIVLEGIQSKKLCKICSKAGDMETLGIATENKLNEIFRARYRITLDHQLLTDHCIFYIKAMYNDLEFEVMLTPASQMVRGSDPSKLKYKLHSIQLKYKMIRSKTLANKAHSVYTNSKEFALPQSDSLEKRHRLASDHQSRRPEMKGPETTYRYIFPDITQVNIIINGLPNMLYNEGCLGLTLT